MESRLQARGARDLASRAVPIGRSVALKIVVLAAVVSIAVATSYALATNPEPPPQTPVVRAADVSTASVAAPGRSNGGEIERLIRAYERRVSTAPNLLDYVFLGRLYTDKGRLTGDAAVYTQAEAALEAALEIAPRDLEAKTLLASTRFTTHDFASALRLADDVTRNDPARYAAAAVAGDAHLELGNYKRAEDTYARLERALPGAAAVTVRRARLAWLTGDVASARALARSAEAAARKEGVFGPGLAWYRVFRAQLEFDSGHYARAGDLYSSAVRTAPKFHVAIAGLGRARAAQGRYALAIRHYLDAIAIVPQPDYVAALGDLYSITDHDDTARRQYSTVAAIATLARADKQIYDRQLAVFYADHDTHLRRALDLTTSELEVRKDIYGYDAQAWALFKNGRLSDARDASDHALRLQTPDARLWYHAGMISAALGDEARARAELHRALELSPAFDPLQAQLARKELAELRGEDR
jgi:tetratricopeptide (TPR) repeat protein